MGGEHQGLSIKILCKLAALQSCLTVALCLLVANVLQAEFVPTPDPSLTEQYEYANEHDIKTLIILTDTGVSQTGSVKVTLLLSESSFLNILLFCY